jgi:small-conductance mechanosensitive channel
VTAILLDIANQHSSILKDPAPKVIFSNFGDSALVFQLYFALSSSFVSNIVKSDLRYEIIEKFNDQNIEIPFPQRSLTLVNPPKSLT